jgi:competence protein ComEC
MQRTVALWRGIYGGWTIRLDFLHALIAAERGRFALWLAVFMGAGVLFYFSLRAEPPLWAGAAVAGPAILGAVLARRLVPLLAILLPLAAAGSGFSACQMAMARALPVAPLPRTGVILTGTVRGVEALPAGRRITIEAVHLSDPDRTYPRRVRVRLHAGDEAALETGDTVRLRALIRPPSAPAYPGGWDLQRDAFFSGLGGYGMALGRVEVLERASPKGPMRIVQWLRDTIDTRIAAVLPGPAGAISATLLTGVTSAIPEPDRAAFRDSGLAHLLAVAGLHIGIVMGLAMGFARTVLAASERASLFWPCKQIAAVTALMVGGGYMLLTGMHVPIARSFVMACLFTLAVLAGRRAVSLRGLALAAVAIMLIEPWEVVGVSFQMSFSAVLALIAGYEALRPWLHRLYGHGSFRRRLALHVAALALTSLLAGTASAPYGAYHFGRVQIYFVLANMAAVPLTAMWVMPAGLIALALMPLGLERLALVPMGWGVEAILWIAHATANLPQATFAVPHIPAWGLVVLSLGIAWLGLWRTRWRLAGIAAILMGLASPAFDRPPDLLVSEDARLIGLRTSSGLFVQQGQGASRFTLDSWRQLWAMGEQSPMPEALPDGSIVCAAGACLLRPRPEGSAALLLGSAEHPAQCRDAAVLISAEPARGRCPRPWPILVDRFTVWRQGATAIWLDPDGARVLTDRAERGARPWVPPPPVPRGRAAQSAQNQQTQ